MNNRLFAFGDSFCQYAWPMWPELIGRCYKKVHNYGYAGSGNFYIFHKSLIELNAVDLTENDTVIIQWSEPLRFDYTDAGYWTNYGIGSAEIFIKNKVEYLNNESTVVLKHLTYMLAMAEFLSNKKCKWLFIFLSNDSMSHKIKLNICDAFDNEYNKIIKGLLKHKKNIVDNISIVESQKQDNSPIAISMSGGSVFRDDHPTPKYTYSYIEKSLTNYLDLNLAKIKNFSDKSEELIIKNKVWHKHNLVNNFNLLQKVFLVNDKK
jgi:hypothetical protein